MSSKQREIPINILLADDDSDDRFFFDKALKSLSFPTQLNSVEDGERLMTYLNDTSIKLPDVLFLDQNMPRKTGMECLIEIKNNTRLKELPVVISSTSLSDDVANDFYKSGAHYYIQKTDFSDLKRVINYVLKLITKSHTRPTRENFIISLTTSSQ